MDDIKKLYDEVVYNYDDVECGKTGVGLFAKTPFEERQVGIAYSTWHTTKRKWGERTWDVPLDGKYLSDDREVLAKHAKMFADADIDFVIIDWSNNTGYNPKTMAALREDFRMIEESVDVMFDVWKDIEGAPKICFLMGPGHSGQENVDNGNHQRKVDQVIMIILQIKQTTICIITTKASHFLSAMAQHRHSTALTPSGTTSVSQYAG